MTPPVAAIDCGTNSTRLLVRSASGEALERRMTITRLGAGVAATGRLDPDAIERTVAVLREFKDLMDAHGVHRVRMTATSAARDASNRDELFDAVEAVVGVRPELLSGEEEGRLSFLGATSELDPSLGPFLVCDIGGGSTELSYGHLAWEDSRSMDIGCVRATETYLHHDPPRAEELSACISVAEAHVDGALREMPAIAEARTFVGLAGTITTAAAVEIGLPEHDPTRTHHFVLKRAAVEDVFRTVATEALEDRLGNPGLDPARADVFVGGMCVLVSVMRRLGIEECLVSESDILDGLAASCVGGAER